MNAGARLAAYAAVLALALGGGALAGAAIGPEPDERPTPAQGTHEPRHPSDGSGANHATAPHPTED